MRDARLAKHSNVRRADTHASDMAPSRFFHVYGKRRSIATTRMKTSRLEGRYGQGMNLHRIHMHLGELIYEEFHNNGHQKILRTIF